MAAASTGRSFAGNGNDTVTEGRDQATVAFPHAECKLFLTASAEERASRRHAELQHRGEKTPTADGGAGPYGEAGAA